MIWLLLMVALIGISNARNVVIMSCKEDYSYTSWGAYSKKYKNGYFLSGQESKFNSSKRDRIFKWRYCRPITETDPYESSYSLSQTKKGQSWSKKCGPNSALIAAESTYVNTIQDREWDFKCAKLDPAKFALGDCYLTEYLNDPGEKLNYDCDDVLTGITTSWDKNEYDRKWKFNFCRIQKPPKYPELTCVDDVVSVELGTEEEATETPSYFINKQETYHNGDVIMIKWGYCAITETMVLTNDRRGRLRDRGRGKGRGSGRGPGNRRKLYNKNKGNKDKAPTTPNPRNKDTKHINTAIDTVEPTSKAWSATCSHLNDGNAAVIGDQIDDGIIPIHRQFECGVLDDSKYILVDCEESFIPDEDSTVFSCPDNGVFRSHGYGRNVKGIDGWTFECCKIEKVYQNSQSFSVPDPQEIVNGLRVNVVYVYAIGFVVCLLMVVNIGLIVKSMCSKKSNHKVVSMQSTDEEI